MVAERCIFESSFFTILRLGKSTFGKCRKFFLPVDSRVFHQEEFNRFFTLVKGAVDWAVTNKVSI